MNPNLLTPWLLGYGYHLIAYSNADYVKFPDRHLSSIRYALLWIGVHGLQSSAKVQATAKIILFAILFMISRCFQFYPGHLIYFLKISSAMYLSTYPILK